VELPDAGARGVRTHKSHALYRLGTCLRSSSLLTSRCMAHVQHAQRTTCVRQRAASARSLDSWDGWLQEECCARSEERTGPWYSTLLVFVSLIPQSDVENLPSSPQSVKLQWWCAEDEKDQPRSPSQPLCLLRQWGVSSQAAFECVF